MATTHLVPAAIGAWICWSPLAAAQPHVALPPVNLGETSFLDGTGGPGLLTHATVTLYAASRFVGPDGHPLPGNNTLVTLSALPHLLYSPPTQIFGGYWAAEILVPLAFIDMTSPSASGAASGVGDIIFSPLIFQAPDTTLFGGKFFHRLDFDVVAPTGKYDRDAPINVGSHLWSVNPYYAFTWFPAPHIETSWRLHYLWNSVNDAPGPAFTAASVQPGQAVFLDGAASLEITKLLRTGVAGYFLQQISDSRANGQDVPGSRERVAALGPGLFFQVGATQLIANAYWEFAVENRPMGARLNIAGLHVW